MTQTWKTTTYTILLSFVLGSASGVLGTAWTSSYLADYAWKLSQLTAPLGLTQERPRNFPSSYKEAVDRLTQSSLPSVAKLYPEQSGPLGYTQNADEVAIVLTSDGWLALRAESFIKNQSLFIHGQMLIGGQLYPVQESVFDSVTQVVFVKVSANGLPVVAFGKGRETRLGEQIFVAQSAQAFESTSVANIVWPVGIAVSSELPSRSLFLTDTFSAGDIVFNLNGEVIGFLKMDREVLLMEQILPAFRSLLEQKKISRPFLGVQFVDLTHAVNISPTISRSHRNGALLSGATSVKNGSPAKIAGLKAADIILSINGETVNNTHGLDELISQYKPNETIQIVVDRAGTQQTFEVILGEQKE